ncbi:GvpL/GvpF family gas vesicle protein [Streptomyces sp. NPDC055092]
MLVVSHVRAQDFQEDALKQHLEDLEWLKAVARAHHGVIEALAAHTTVLPPTIRGPRRPGSSRDGPAPWARLPT